MTIKYMCRHCGKQLQDEFGDELAEVLKDFTPKWQLCKRCLDNTKPLDTYEFVTKEMQS